MKIAAAIVTDRGGRTCHAAIVARELGVPAVVGAADATAALEDRRDGDRLLRRRRGRPRLRGRAAVRGDACRAERRSSAPRTEIMVNLGNPDLAFRTAMMPNDGVGLARMEFIISEHIGVHPMALVASREGDVAGGAARDRAAGAQLSRRRADFFVEKLSEGVGTIAAAFYPQAGDRAAVRLQDQRICAACSAARASSRRKTTRCSASAAPRATRIRPMPTASRSNARRCGACATTMGLTNLRIMVPFCRRVEEARRVIEAMASHGLKRGENGLEIYVMCEIPNNVIQIDAFAELFDGFSIGSNDLTQLTLGVDRDSEIVAFDFDERDPGMLEMLRLAVTGAKRNGRHVGICGEAPANYPEIARYLTQARHRLDQRQSVEPAAHHAGGERGRGGGGRDAAESGGVAGHPAVMRLNPSS